jgi:methylated-DNA-[protein]-cysteine S-methyltransferase
LGRPRIVVDGITVFPTPLGWVSAAWLDDGLRALTFGHRGPQQAVAALGLQEDSPEIRRLGADTTDDFARRLRAYAEGKPDDFLDVPIVVAGLTRFRQKVMHECRRIAYGNTITYGELAASVGSPKAARAVGGVMANNTIALVVPCHRVVGAGGRLGGYSAPSGVRMKKRLLRLEGAI